MQTDYFNSFPLTQASSCGPDFFHLIDDGIIGQGDFVGWDDTDQTVDSISCLGPVVEAMVIF